GYSALSGSHPSQQRSRTLQVNRQRTGCGCAGYAVRKTVLNKNAVLKILGGNYRGVIAKCYGRANQENVSQIVLDSTRDGQGNIGAHIDGTRLSGVSRTDNEPTSGSC